MLLPADLLLSLTSAQQPGRADASGQSVLPVVDVAAVQSWLDAPGEQGGDAQTDARALINKLLSGMTEQQSDSFAADFVTNLQALLPPEQPRQLTVGANFIETAEPALPVQWTVDELLKFSEQILPPSALQSPTDQQGGSELPSIEQNLPHVLLSALAALQGQTLQDQSGQSQAMQSQAMQSQAMQGQTLASQSNQSPVSYDLALQRQQGVQSPLTVQGAAQRPLSSDSTILPQSSPTSEMDTKPVVNSTAGQAPDDSAELKGVSSMPLTDNQSRTPSMGPGQSSDLSQSQSAIVTQSPSYAAAQAQTQSLSQPQTSELTQPVQNQPAPTVVMPATTTDGDNTPATTTTNDPRPVTTPVAPDPDPKTGPQTDSATWRTMSPDGLTMTDPMTQTTRRPLVAAIDAALHGSGTESGRSVDQVPLRQEGAALLSTAAPTAGELAQELYGADQRRQQAAQAREASVASQQFTAPGRAVSDNLQMGTFGQTQWGENVSRQLMMMTANGVNSAQIRLDPPELGTLTIKVKLIDQAATVNFVSQHAMVRDALELQIPRLQEQFRQEGLDLVDVSVSDQSAQQGGSQGEERRNGRGDRLSGMDEDEMLIGQTSVHQSNHLIDFYA